MAILKTVCLININNSSELVSKYVNKLLISKKNSGKNSSWKNSRKTLNYSCLIVITVHNSMSFRIKFEKELRTIGKS